MNASLCADSKTELLKNLKPYGIDKLTDLHFFVCGAPHVELNCFSLSTGQLIKPVSVTSWLFSVTSIEAWAYKGFVPWDYMTAMRRADKPVCFVVPDTLLKLFKTEKGRGLLRSVSNLTGRPCFLVTRSTSCTGKTAGDGSLEKLVQWSFEKAYSEEKPQKDINPYVKSDPAAASCLVPWNCDGEEVPRFSPDEDKVLILTPSCSLNLPDPLERYQQHLMWCYDQYAALQAKPEAKALAPAINADPWDSSSRSGALGRWRSDV